MKFIIKSIKYFFPVSIIFALCITLYYLPIYALPSTFISLENAGEVVSQEKGENKEIEIPEKEIKKISKNFTTNILVYHHVSDHLNEITNVSVEEFEKHLIYLKEEGYYTITFKELENYLYSGKEAPKKAVIITFDDGYIDNYQNAYPLLKKYNFVGSFAIVTDLVGTDLYGQRWYMNWDELEEMVNNNMEITSHTVSHKYLSGFNENVILRELKESKKVLEKKLGISVTTLVYPYGAIPPNSVSILKSSGYTSARSYTDSIVAPSLNNIYSLPVRRIYNGTDFVVLI